MELTENLDVEADVSDCEKYTFVKVDAPAEGIRRGRTVAELDEDSVLADVRREALQLEGLETGPADESRVRGDELAEALDKAFVIHSGRGLLCRRELRRSMLADRFVR